MNNKYTIITHMCAINYENGPRSKIQTNIIYHFFLFFLFISVYITIMHRVVVKKNIFTYVWEYI